MEIPCKSCIVMALCNATVKRLDGVYKVNYIVRELAYKCKLFETWSKFLDAYYWGKPLFTDTVTEFCNFYKIKENIHPDNNLRRHLSYFNCYCSPCRGCLTFSICKNEFQREIEKHEKRFLTEAAEKREIVLRFSIDKTLCQKCYLVKRFVTKIICYTNGSAVTRYVNKKIDIVAKEFGL